MELTLFLFRELFLSAFLGFITVTILDRKWKDINHKKIEQGFEVIEHYHFGIILIGMGIIASAISPLSYFLLAAGMGLIFYELKQDDYLACKSGHFRNSSVIGMVLTIGIIVVYFF